MELAIPSSTLSKTACPAVPRRAPNSDRNDWIEGAIDILANWSHVYASKSWPKPRGVTSGKFPLAFRDRKDCSDAVLERWREGRIKDIEKPLGAPAAKRTSRTHRNSWRQPQPQGHVDRAMAWDWPATTAKQRRWSRPKGPYRLRYAQVFGSPAACRKPRQRAAACCSTPAFSACLMHYGCSDENPPDLKQRISERIVSPKTRSLAAISAQPLSFAGASHLPCQAASSSTN